MKTPLFILLTAVLALSAARADTPEAILKDYRKAANTALEKLNATLEKEGAAIVSSLTAKSEIASAQNLSRQIKDRINGETVAKPEPAAAQLFSQYESARGNLLKPIQTAATKRIESMLKLAGGQKLETVNELTDARAEIESGKIGGTVPFPTRWNYYAEEKGSAVATMEIKTNGTWALDIKSSGKKEIGTWKPGKSQDIITLTFNTSSWDMIMDGTTATMFRPDSGKRWLRAIGSAH